MKEIVTLKNGEKVIIRLPLIEDAEGLLAMLQNSVATSDSLLLTSEEANLTIEQEKEWLTNVLNNKHTIMLIATHNNRIIANAEVNMGAIVKKRHWATLGITIVDDWRNLGLGKILITRLILIAKEITTVEVIALDVFANNSRAIRLYEKLGFKKEAQIKDNFKQASGEYVDNIIMTLRIK